MASGRLLRALARASWADRALLAEAAAWLALARLAVLALPFRLIASRLGVHMEESARTDDPDRVRTGRRVGWAIAAVSIRAPWRTKCLEQAIAGKVMLRGRGIPTTMYLGVAPGAAQTHSPHDFHAWLRLGVLNVTGGAQVEQYTVLSTFADKPRPGQP